VATGALMSCRGLCKHFTCNRLRTTFQLTLGMPTEPVDIRRAALGDARLLAELGARTFRATYPMTPAAEAEAYVAGAFTKELFEIYLQDPNVSLLVGRLSARAIGYAQLRIAPAPKCVTGLVPMELMRLYLEHDAQGAGYGSAFMSAVFQEARRKNCRTVWLGVYSQNRKALAFYARWGFKIVGNNDFVMGGSVYNDPVMARAVEDI
jgi:diamine N-acetyltransferase